LNTIIPNITTCPINPRQIVETYKKFFSINDLKNNVVNAAQTNIIRSYGGNLSFCAKIIESRVGTAEKCNKTIVIQPNV
jgi:hypothetical protein